MRKKKEKEKKKKEEKDDGDHDGDEDDDHEVQNISWWKKNWRVKLKPLKPVFYRNVNKAKPYARGKCQNQAII